MKKYIIAPMLGVALLSGWAVGTAVNAHTVHLLGRGTQGQDTQTTENATETEVETTALTSVIPVVKSTMPTSPATNQVDGAVLINSNIFVPLVPKIVSEEGTLLLSDSPEYVGKEHGILYEDTVTGNSRVYFYHVNEVSEVRKIVVILKNNTDKVATVTVNRTLATKPTDAYFEVGRELSRLELEATSRAPQTEQVEPGKTMLLFPQLEKIAVRKDQLFSGLIDFTTNVPVKVSVMMVPLQYKPVGALLTEPVLPYDDVHLRGTYLGMNREVAVEPTYSPMIGAASLELANGREDGFLKGYDMTMQSMPAILNTTAAVNNVENTGNYGVSSTITVPTRKGTYDVFFNPEGGAYAGSIVITYQGKSKIYDVPDKGRAYLGHKTMYDVQYLDTFEGGTPIIIQFMPAGASNLPIRFLFVPHKKQVERDNHSPINAKK